MKDKSSLCRGMFIRSHGRSGWFATRIIWRNGDMFAGVGTLDKFIGNACLLWISVSNPPL